MDPKELIIIQNDISKLKLENITIQQNINKVIEKCEDVIKLKEETIILKLENAKLTFENDNFKLKNNKSSEVMICFALMGIMMMIRIIPLVLLYYGVRMIFIR
jgi:hypothetical protein